MSTKSGVNFYKILVLLNTIVSMIITYQIILYNIEKIDFKLYFILFYAVIWFFSLYKLYNFSSLGLKLYIMLVIFGFLLNITSNIQQFGNFYYICTLFEHLIIGAIIALSFFFYYKKKNLNNLGMKNEYIN